MKYKKENDKIIIYGSDDFKISHILECGQIFRFVKHGEEDYTVYFKDNFARLVENNNTIIITSNNIDECIEFFDLDRDYSIIKNKLLDSDVKVITDGIKYGHGIRILKGDPEEIIFSFIISANNNIKRIQKIINKLCMIGEDKGGYNAFPTALQIASASEEFMAALGAGYRTSYLKETARELTKVDLKEKAKLSTNELKKWLISLKGVGPKVASCILLFGFNRWDNFPVDTWIEKVYHEYFFSGHKTRPQIEAFFLEKFGAMSGIVQQYLFFSSRENKLK